MKGSVVFAGLLIVLGFGLIMAALERTAFANPKKCCEYVVYETSTGSAPSPPCLAAHGLQKCVYLSNCDATGTSGWIDGKCKATLDINDKCAIGQTTKTTHSFDWVCEEGHYPECGCYFEINDNDPVGTVQVGDCAGSFTMCS